MISALVITCNEERNIGTCLKTLSFCDEILLIDDNSTDKTRKIAKALGATVFERSLDANFAAQRNFGLGKAQGEWVLFVDADERVSPELASEIQKKIGNTTKSGFRIKRKTFLWGRGLKGSQDRFEPIRLAKKKAGFWKRRVHEFWDLSGNVGTLENWLLHYPHQTLREFLKEVDFYSTLHAQDLKEEGKNANVLKVIIWPGGKFLENWIWRKGFLDGTRGFAVAAMMSFHSFLAWSKLWFLRTRK